MNSFSTWVRTGLFCLAAAAIPFSTGCGMDVGVSGSTGTGGHATGSGGGCANGVTSGGTGGAGMTTGVGGGGAFCGGLGGIQCAADEFCDYPDNSCGIADGGGTCQKRPMVCDTSYSPTCGCDGTTYTLPCEANMAGQDVSILGNCPPPAERFACGSQFCVKATEFCSKLTGGLPEQGSSYSCLPLPQGCAPTPSCACLGGVACGDQCTATNDGGLLVPCAAP